MNEDPASLDRLHDLVVPPPVPWWPTPGWWIVIGMLMAALVMILVKSFIRWQAGRYRREALALLDDPAVHPSQWPVILKRCALAAWPRGAVASLTGNAWDQFFGKYPSPGTGGRIEELAFTTEHDASELKEAARAWIKHHRKEDAP